MSEFVAGQTVVYVQGWFKHETRRILDVKPEYHADGTDALIVLNPDGKVSGPLRADWFGEAP